MWGYRMVVPRKFKENILHAAYSRMVKIKMKVRSFF